MSKDFFAVAAFKWSCKKKKSFKISFHDSFAFSVSWFPFLVLHSLNHCCLAFEFMATYKCKSKYVGYFDSQKLKNTWRQRDPAEPSDWIPFLELV